ncbi:Ig-like domain-containing protein [Butyricicoccus pullicaecorum]|uniref:SLH domain-containing protein n=1 Tax=Butyricicoccus pullicaecorum TaxID=501571 RepID=A0A1Y4LRX2_9FIRM|nr:S-layer homology domain-containing protein [Butyricicoccus pullicaecorum]OUP59405.1 hypothetical protein B5F15_04960 [Butyricicoccus pullicaecorum]
MKKQIQRVISGIVVVTMLSLMCPTLTFAVSEEVKDTSQWILSEAYYDDEQQSFILTDDYTQWDTGSIWYNTPCEDAFTIELDYYTGSPDRSLGGADGIAIAFYADFNYEMVGGEELGFNGSKGYGIELDTYYNSHRGDPDYNHIALIQESVGNHLVTEKLPESEDEQWHHLKVTVEDGVCSAYVDNALKLSHEVKPTGYGWIGITASTGDGENLHAVRNVVVAVDNAAKYLDLELSHERLTDSEGYYSYEITAAIKNIAEATAKNMILLFASESSLTLAEDSQKVISIGDLPSGAEKTVSWKVTAPWPEESGPAVYSVIADIDNQTATLLKENYIYLLSKNENDNSFDFEIDQWNFSNNFTYFTDYKIVDGKAVWDEDYYLTDTDYSILQSNLSSNTEKLLVDSQKHKHWSGSCYGMSATAILAKMDVVNPHFLQALGAENLYEVSKYNDDKVESFINFYQLQQYTTVASNNKAEFSLKPTTEQLQIIEDKAEAVLTGGSPFILSLSGEKGGHAIVAYGIEHKGDGIFGSWGWKSGYDSRILIYDCNNPDAPIYLYYNTGTDEWCIPEYNKDYTPGTDFHATKLTRALDDLQIIDSVNYDIETQNHYARLLFESQADEYFLKQDDKTIKIDGNTDLREEGIITLYDTNITADGAASPSTLNLLLPSLTESYVVEPISGESCKFDMIYKNTMLTAAVDNAQSISFSPDNTISARGTDGMFELGICANEGYYNLPWYLVSIKGKNSENISLKTLEEGILVEGDNLNDITITSKDKGGNTQQNSFSTAYDKVIIQATEEDRMVVKADTDNDGTFETDISDTDGQEVYASQVDVTPAVAQLCIDNTLALTCDLTPANSVDQITWKSSDPKIATVDQQGIVTGISQGDVIITASTERDIKGECRIKVVAEDSSNIPVTGVMLNTAKVEFNHVGENYQVTAHVLPTNATNRTVAWTSSNPEIVTVDTNGKITAVKNGVATITATTQDGNYTASCEVRVNSDTSNGGAYHPEVGSTSSSSSDRYAINKPSDVENGSIKVSDSKAEKGDTVTITVTPDEGYELDELVVYDEDGDEIDLKDKGDGKYTFEMPKSDVEIEVSFAVIEVETVKADFADVADDSWYADAVQYVFENGMMSGTSETTFSPNLTTTRGMIVTILYSLENEPAITGTTAFTDVAADQYYANAVAWAAQNGIVAGIDATTFAPNKAITREQMAAILYRYAQFKGYDVSAKADLSVYTDAASVSAYATDAMAWANGAQLITGTITTTLSPAGNAIRAQVAAILMRFCENIAK